MTLCHKLHYVNVYRITSHGQVTVNYISLLIQLTLTLYMTLMLDISICCDVCRQML